MASSSSFLTEEQLQCSICLDVFTDPVTTTCGHNFCMACLNKFWSNSQQCQCPICKKEFQGRPELSINTFISGLAADFRKSIQVKAAQPSLQEQVPVQSEVFCDMCPEEKRKAVKSCLDCGVSYCQTHLERHRAAPKFKKHKLMEPVENLEDYLCKKHEKPLELFCRDDLMCVCLFCIEADHKSHNIVSIEEESQDKKTQLGSLQMDIQKIVQEKQKKIDEIKESVAQSKRDTEREIAESVKVFTALLCCIERSQADLQEVMEEQQRAAEQQAEGLMKELEQEITELKRRDTELEQLSHTEDHLHLLQVSPALCSPPHTKPSVSFSVCAEKCVDTLRKALAQLEKSLNQEMEKIPGIKLKRIQQFEVDATLDPDTAHPYLRLSNDGKQVRTGNVRQKLPDNPERFDPCVDVLGKEGFSSGRFYYEVQVRGKTWWDLGVARESINRKGPITLSPENGYWVLWLTNGDEYKALDSPNVRLSLSQKPQTVGVFVDYEEGLVSFYDVEAKTHIYSFTGQSFTEKLFPFLSPCLNVGGKNAAPLVISPVSHI